MSKSLQDQLLNAGLITGNQVKKAKSDKRKQNKLQQKQKVKHVDENKLSLQQSLEEKKALDRQLNQQQQERVEQKAVTAQIRQLIVLNSQAQDAEGEAYHFDDAGTMKTIYVADALRKQIILGKMAIVKLDKTYHLVAAQVAEKIQARDEKYIVLIHSKKESSGAEDEAYKDFQIPDDLLW